MFLSNIILVSNIKETNMKKFICFIIVFCGLLITSCDFATDPSSDNTHIRKAIGTVWNEEIWVGNVDIYHFGTYDDKTPENEGFKNGSSVYFEADVMLHNKNNHGGTTYWGKLLLIRKYN
jgi:hypothetical protein